MKALTFIATAYLLLTQILAQSPGQLDPSFMAPVALLPSQGTNHAGVLALPDGRLIVHGQVKDGFGGIARLHPNGTVDPTFLPGAGAQLENQAAFVSDVQVQTDGRLILIGSFTRFDNSTAPGIVRLQPDGALDPSFKPGVNLQPRLTRLLSDGRLIIQNWDLQLYRLKSDGADDGVNPQFDTLFQPHPVLGTTNGGYLMQHSLIFIDETSAEGRLALVSAAGNITHEVVWRGTQMEGTALSDGRFLVWGIIEAINGQNVTNLAILKPDLTVDPAFNCTVSGPITAATVTSDGGVALVGSFDAVNGTPRRGAARVGSNGSLVADFAPAGFDLTSPFAQTGVALVGSRTVVSGHFSSYQGQPRAGLLALLDNGALDPSFPGTSIPASPDNFVTAVARTPGGGYYLAGSFKRIGGIVANGLVRTSIDGVVDPGFNIGLGFNGAVFALAVLPDGGVIAGGQFTSFNGHPCGSIVRIRSDGTRDPDFNANPGFAGQTFTVAALALLPDERVMVGGQFSTYNGTARDGIARLLKNGQLDTSFNPGTGITSPANRIILGITLLPGGKMLLNGRFLQYNGANQGHAARILSNGSLDATFTGGAGDFIRCLTVLPNDRIIVAGGFTRSIGVDQNHVARWHPDGALDTSFNAGRNLDGAVRSMAVQPDGSVVLGGLFRNYGQVPRPGLARLNPNGSLDAGFNPGAGLQASGFIPTAEVLLLQGESGVIVAGGFETYDHQARSHVVRVFTSAPPAEAPLLQIKIQPDGWAEISWPETPGFGLESTSSLLPPAWAPVTGVPPAQQGQRIYLTLPEEDSRFFRLRK